MGQSPNGLATGSVKMTETSKVKFPQNSTSLFLGSFPGLNPGPPYSHYCYYRY